MPLWRENGRWGYWGGSGPRYTGCVGYAGTGGDTISERDWEECDGAPGYEIVVVGYADDGIDGEVSAKAEGVWKAGSGWVAGTVRGTDGDMRREPAIGVRYRREEREDCGRLSWLGA